MMNADAYFSFAREREAIRRRRLAGQPWPWTDDPVFQTWSFCNVHRENDRTTAWFRDHVRSRLDGWRAVEATVCFRFFNLIETGECVRSPARRVEARRTYRRPAQDDCRAPSFGRVRIASRGEHGRPKLENILDSIEAAREQLPARAETWGGSLRGAWLDLWRHAVPRSARPCTKSCRSSLDLGAQRRHGHQHVGVDRQRVPQRPRMGADWPARRARQLSRRGSGVGDADADSVGDRPRSGATGRTRTRRGSCVRSSIGPARRRRSFGREPGDG